MPASIPGLVAAGPLPGGSTAATVRDAINALRDLLASVPGVAQRVSVTIASGVAAPWTSWGATIPAGGLIRVDTEGSAAADDLDRIDPDGLLDAASSTASRLIMLSSVDAGRVVTIRHAQGGSGEIRTPDGQNWALASPETVLVAVWDAAASPRCWRVLGALGGPILAPWAQPLRLASWSTGGRPTAATGLLGLNTTLGRPEVYDGSGWRELAGPPAYVGTAALQTGAVAYSAIAHGLGAVPSLTQVRLECLTTEHGYAVGAEVDAAHARSGDGSPAVAVAWTDAHCLISQRVSVRLIRRDSPSNDAALDVSKWRWRVRAWR